MAGQTSRPAPLVRAAGTFSARFESVPNRAASIRVKLRQTAAYAMPAAGFDRPPFAERTTDAIELSIFIF